VIAILLPLFAVLVQLERLSSTRTRSPRAQLVTWSLVTARDELERGGAVINGVRCEQPSAWRVCGAGGELDDYTYVCRDHVALVRQPGDVIWRV
jgi:hypothetical protein